MNTLAKLLKSCHTLLYYSNHKHCIRQQAKLELQILFSVCPLLPLLIINAIISNQMYETSRSLKQNEKLYKHKKKQIAVSKMVHLLKQSIFTSLSRSFTMMKNHQLLTYSSLQPKSTNSIHAQFLWHCATLIQTHFRGYIQQKRYLQFLPIYRRFRELLYAGVLGWRVRRIMKLQPLKTQIKLIKDKITNGQLNMARIHKRELIDEIGRLSKKGRWIEIQQQSYKLDKRRKQSVNKQNVSLYGNVKSKSIKNIFGERRQGAPLGNRKEESRRANTKALVRQNVKMVKIENTSTKQSNRSRVQQTETFTYREKSRNHLPTNSYDEIPIKGHQDFYALLQEKCQMAIEETKKTRRGLNAKQPNNQFKTLKQNNHISSKVSVQTPPQPQEESSSQSQEDKHSIIDQIQTHFSNQQLEQQSEPHQREIFKPKASKFQKLKVTLTSNSKIESFIRSESSSRARGSRNHHIPIQNVKADDLPKFLVRIRSNQKLSCISQLLRAYEEVYLIKKDDLALKMKQLRSTSGKPSECQEWI